MKVIKNVLKTFSLEIIIALSIPVALLAPAITSLIVGKSFSEAPMLHIVGTVLIGAVWIVSAINLHRWLK